MTGQIQWGMLRRSRNIEEAINDFDLSVDLRLFLLATRHANANGHAIFKPSEVAESLPKVNKATGESGIYGNRHLRDVMNLLIGGGLLAPVSKLPDKGPSCLVLPTHVWEYGGKHRAGMCPVHKNSMVWLGGWGWFDPDRLEEPSSAAKVVQEWELIA